MVGDLGNDKHNLVLSAVQLWLLGRAPLATDDEEVGGLGHPEPAVGAAVGAGSAARGKVVLWVSAAAGLEDGAVRVLADVVTVGGADKDGLVGRSGEQSGAARVAASVATCSSGRV